MPVRLIDPRDEVARRVLPPAPRLPSLAGRRVALVDISKPGGDVFLDRLATHLTRAHAVRVSRSTKPAFAKLAPAALLDELRGAEAVILALAD